MNFKTVNTHNFIALEKSLWFPLKLLVFYQLIEAGRNKTKLQNQGPNYSKKADCDLLLGPH